MYQRVKEYIRRYHMLDGRDRVIAGVSGGADSICLLFMLIELSRESGFSVSAVHVHHGLRGDAADADAAFVKKLCGEQGVELRIFYEDVRGYAREKGLTQEEAGRNLRRENFLRVLEETGGTKIALAHHQNDNAETLIWNLCRGCGLRGLKGIAPAAGVWIRPLLCLKREEIESYLENRGISYCTDESNLTDDYTRNRIRNHVTPYLEQHVNSRAVLHMSETMEQMRLVGEFVEQEVKRYGDMCIRYRDEETEVSGRGRSGALVSGAVLYDAKFQQVPEALRGFVLQEMICRVAGRRKDIGNIHIKILEELLVKQVGRQVQLPYGVCARRCYEGIELFVLPPRESPGETEYELFGDMDEGTLHTCPVEARVFQRTADMVIFPENPYTKWFDYDIIKNTVKIRHREPGDYITIAKDGGAQKLKQYFINEKIPGSLRDKIWLAADGKHIMWIVGYRQNQKYQIAEKTRRILELKFYGGQDDGRKRQSDDFRSGGCEKD